MLYNANTTYKINKRREENILFDENKYEIIGELGRGGTAAVYLVRHKGLGVLRAIKVIPKNHRNTNSYFVEINILKNVSIQGIPLIYDVGEDKESYYIVEEYINGQDFLKYIEEGIRTKEDLADCICQICDIIISLHNLSPYPVVYNDIKPDNIVVRNGQVYIVDYGNCRICKKESKSPNDLFMASIENVTPEHFRGETPDIRTDVYGIGMLIQDIYQRRRNLFKEDRDFLNNVIEGCLEKESINRIQSPIVIKKYFEDIVNSGNDDFNAKNIMKNNGIDIYVCGCRKYSGVTHFSVGFTKYLSEKNRKAVYIESSKDSGISQYFEEEQRKGFYTYEGCKLLPYYGDFVLDSNQTFEGMRIYDRGVCKEGQKMDGKIIIMLVTDRKSYGEIEHNVFKENVKNEIIYVVNFSDIEGYRRFDRNTDKKAIFMPYFPNPFIQNKDTKIFYDKVYKTVLKVSEKEGSYR